MKLKYFFSFVFTIYFQIALQAQDSIHISGYFNGNTKYAKVVVNKFGVGTYPIAAVVIKEGKFKITAPSTIEPGVYRLQYSQSEKEYLDVIIDGKEKEISFELDLNASGKKPVFSQSIQNIKWRNFQKIAASSIHKIEAMNQLLASYPNTTDKIVQQVIAERKLQIGIFEKQYNSFKSTKSWAAKMIVNRPCFFSNPSDDFRLQNYEAHLHYWDKINTSNPVLINSPLYTEHILNYIRYYMNPEMEYSEKESVEGFKKSVDTIISRFSKNEITKKFAIKYLQLGFKEIGQEEILRYLDEKYQNLIAQCQNDEEKAAFNERMRGYETMKEGVLAPDINTMDYFGKPFHLFDVQKDYTMIVFWASWCPHCEIEMPKLQEFALKNAKVNVIAISLDEEKKAYEASILKYPNAIHICDFKKWEGISVKDYHIVATPTVVVLDKNKKIIGKFPNFETASASILSTTPLK